MTKFDRLRVLNLEDNDADAALIQRALTSERLDVDYRRAETREDFLAHLTGGVDIVLADHSLPRFTSVDALALLKEQAPDVPFIVVSGSITEDLAVTMLRQGAADYVLKDRLARLGPAVHRALRECGLQREQAEADRASRASEALQRSVLTSLSAHIAVLDATGTIVAVNRAWETFARANGAPEPRHTGVGANYLDVCRRAAASDPSAQAALEGILRVLHGEESLFRYEYPCHAQDRRRWFVMYVTPLEGHAGGVVVSHENITERKQGEDQVRQSEALFKAVSDSSLDGIVVFAAVRDAAGRIVDFEIRLVNPRGAELSRHAPEVLVGRLMLDLFPGMLTEGLFDLYRHVVETGEPARREFFYAHEGITAWFATAVVRLNDGVAVTLRDVTEQKAREEALEYANRRFEALGENIPGVVYKFVQLPDGTPRFTYLSQRAPKLFERTMEELLSDAAILFDAIHPEDRPGLEASIQASVTSLEPWDWQGRIVVANMVKWVHGASRPALREGGGIVWNGLLMDVTSRVQVEEALRESRRHQQALFENALDAILITDDDGRYVDANPAACTLFGYSREELCRMNVWDAVSSSDAKKARVQWKAFVQAGQQSGEYQLQRRDGSVRDVDFRAVANIVPGRHLSIVRDVTERKQEQTSRNRLAAIVESASDAIVGITPDGFITSWNAAAEKLYGYAAAEAGGESIGFLLPDERGREYEQILAALVRGERRDRFDTVHRRKDGSLIDVSLSVSPIRDERGRIVGCASISRDISMQKRFVREVLAAKRKAEEMNRLKSAFLANMSHEIRTPLTSIIGFSELLEEELPEDKQIFVRHIHSNSERLFDTLTAVLELSQFESGSYEFRPERLSLAHEVEKSLKPFLPRAYARGLRLDLQVEAPGVHVEADAAALGRVLHHLLSNAVKFTTRGGITVSVVTPEDGYVAVRIRDTGIGISPAFLPRLFDEFEQESAGDDREFEGAGLGLPIVRRLMDAMGGTIQVESTQGAGSTFTIRFPLATAGPSIRQHDMVNALASPEHLSEERMLARVARNQQSPEVPGAEKPPVDASSPAGHAPLEQTATGVVPGDGAAGEMAGERPALPVALSVALPVETKRARVLVVEDNETTRSLLRLMLEPAYDLVLEASLDGALEAAGAGAFDLVLLDINLGERRTGIEVLHALRDLPPYQTVPAVACTAYALPGDEARFLKVGFQGYVSKPVKKANLVAAIETALSAQVRPPVDVATSSTLTVELPPLPETLPAIVQLLSRSDDAPDVDRLTGVLSRDPVTSGWVLRHVNSAYYGLRHHVTSIDRAVTLLGFEPVCNLVLMEVLSQTFSDVSSGRPRDVYEYLMKTSIATAAFARELAEHFSVANPDTAFSAGMLHQIGRLALLSHNPTAYAQMWEDGETPHLLVAPSLGQELLRFDADHVEVGGQIARMWDLSREISTSILYYHRFHQARLKQERPYVLLVAVGHIAGAALVASDAAPCTFSAAGFDGSLRALALLAGCTEDEVLARLSEKAEAVREFIGIAFHT